MGLLAQAECLYLLSGLPLEEARKIREDEEIEFNRAEAKELLQKSEAKEKARKQQTRNITIGVMTILGLLSIGLIITALVAHGNANDATNSKNNALAQATVADQQKQNAVMQAALVDNQKQTAVAAQIATQ